jgi:hypothetical protein
MINLFFSPATTEVGAAAERRSKTDTPQMPPQAPQQR